MGPAAPDPPDAAVAASSNRTAGALRDDTSWVRRALVAILGQITAPAGWTVVVAALLILLMGVAVFVTTPPIYMRLDTYLCNLPAVVVAGGAEHEALQISNARAVLYPLAKGGQALVVRGEVRNQSDQPQAATDAQLQLKDAHGFIVAQSRAPLGFAPRLLEVFRLTDDQTWQSLVHQTRAIGRAPLAPQATATFVLVVVQPPEVLRDTVPEISLL